MRPVPVSGPESGQLQFHLRRFLDLQLNSIVKELAPRLGEVRGSVIDVGAGKSPWTNWLPPETTYVGLDIVDAESFGMHGDRSDIVFFDGGSFPFHDNSFDNAICVEVLEHVRDPELLLKEIARVLKPNGQLLLTIPWSARVHYSPNDYQRFTQFGLGLIFESAGLEIQVLNERGSDISVIANKLLVRNMALFRPLGLFATVARGLVGTALAPLTLLFLMIGHLADSRKWGLLEDPLGYFVQARKQ